MRFVSAVGIAALFLSSNLFAWDSAGDPDRMKWFEHDKLGMFIHWGPYSYLAGEWSGRRIPVGTEAEWIMQRFNIPVAEYREMAHHLNPVNFDADAWVRLANAAGMKYVVITAKHHDGFAMYHSRVSNYNIVDWTPFKRDPLKELAEACHRAGIRFCVYYSHREDWDHPDGYGNNWDYDRSKKDFARYLEEKSKPQLRELLSNYGPLGLVWFDRGMDTNEHAREFVDIVHTLQPRCLINGRVGGYGQDLMGDYQDMNDNGMPTGGLEEYWETPQTLNTTWGYSKYDQQWKTPGEVIHRMVEIVGKGGNYLLNVGPMADGTIPAASVATLRKVGEWMETNGESIYGTTASPLPEQPWGRTTVKGNLVYLHVFSAQAAWRGIKETTNSADLAAPRESVVRESVESSPADERLRVSGLENTVREAYRLAIPTQKLPVAKDNSNIVITLSGPARDANDDVVVLRLDGPPRVNPPVITQGSDAPFHLDYRPALTVGKAKKRFNREGGFHIAKWTGPGDAIRWSLLVSQSGDYRVRIRYAASEESQGNRYSIRVAGQTINAAVVATGEGYHFRDFDLGTLKIATAGPYMVEIEPGAEYGHNLMFFQSLELVPAGPLMVE
jgi:alpha-L-fucosidase